MTSGLYGNVFSDVMSRVCDIDTSVWPSKFDVLDQEGAFRLLRYRPEAEQRYRPPVLIVYAFINRPYILDLRTDISVVHKYLQAGFDVYMIDWGYPNAADKYIDLDDYVDYLDKSAELIMERSGEDKLSLHGYCLGGTLSTIYSALRPQNVKNLVLQATPIDFSTPNLMAVWARAVDAEKITDAFQMAPGGFLNVGFLLVDPINLIVGKYASFLDMLESDEAMESFLCMDRWIFDSPSIPAETYKQYINQWYKQNLIVKGQFQALGETVDLKKIECSLLVLLAKHDHIAPPQATRVLLDMVSSKDKEAYEIDKGHVGIVTSSTSHREFWPRVVQWLEQRSTKVKARAPRVKSEAPGSRA